MLTKLMLFITSMICLLPCSSLADPVLLDEDFSEIISIPYDEQQPSAGQYVYSFSYPHVDESDPRAPLINSYYEYQAKDARDYNAPNMADYYADLGQSVRVEISYEITCSNDEYFSVRIYKKEDAGEEPIETWSGNTFSLEKGMPGSVCSLPVLLGILETGETDNWYEERQAGKAREAVLSLIWDQIADAGGGISYYDDLTQEDLEYLLDPELDFWLDQSGNPVFYILPGQAAEADYGLLTFPVSLEDIYDEI